MLRVFANGDLGASPLHSVIVRKSASAEDVTISEGMGRDCFAACFVTSFLAASARNDIGRLRRGEGYRVRG